MSVSKTYEDALRQEIKFYEEGLQTEAELMKRLRGYKTDYYQLHRADFHENREKLDKFDVIYNAITSNIGG